MAYTFTQPIRYYKANDPYYYEVDNIPLRQLEENILYLKENSSLGGGEGGSGGGGGSGYLTATDELDLKMIKQLRPKALGGRRIQVNAGTFTSRVNDAFNPDDALLSLVSSGRTVTYPDLTQSLSVDRDSIWDAFIESSVGAGALPYNMNGLEILYTFHSAPGGIGESWLTTTSPGENYPNYLDVPENEFKDTWPGFNKFSPLTPAKLAQKIYFTPPRLQGIHLAFVKTWRGVFRTAVVDFPESTISIPAWSDDDFWYYDDQGDKQEITDATQRIDLLVAYSLPIDSSSTTLSDYESAFCETAGTPSPTTITTPTLGLVRGAGIGIKKEEISGLAGINSEGGCEDPGSAGSARILANQNDSDTGANVGITNDNGDKVHGSFPSPDDLLNMAPLLALDVQSDNFQLIGQAALPLAYVVTTKSEGASDIVDNDIIDIRPFLRTTELTYNERAGVAGANPPLSFANPAVGTYQLQQAIDTVQTGGGGGSPGTHNGRALYTDFIMGGLAYGVEGTLLTMNENGGESGDPWGPNTTNSSYLASDDQTYSFASLTSSKAFLNSVDQSLREAFLEWVYNTRQAYLKRWISDPNSPYSSNTGTYLGLPAGAEGRNIPLYPEWDQPMDGTNYATVMGTATGSANLKSPKPTWWMWFEGMNSNRPLAYVPGGIVSTKGTVGSSSWLDKQYGFGFGPDNSTTNGFEGKTAVAVVTKKLEITFPQWVNYYDILVEYVNCNPVAATTSDSRATSYGLGTGLYINMGPLVGVGEQKKAIATVNSISSRNPDLVGDGRIQDVQGTKAVTADRKSPIVSDLLYQWLSYGIALPQFRNSNWNMMQQTEALNTVTRFAPKLGASYYPTVKFTIIGYTDRPVDNNEAYNTTNGYTLLQNTTGGNINELLPSTAPVTTGTTEINIENIK